MSKRYDVRWWGFRSSIPFRIDYDWYVCIDRAISTLSCSYCIWNSYCHNHGRIQPNFPLISMIWYSWIDSPGSLQYVYYVPYAAILHIFLLFSMICYVTFNRLPCPNDKMYGNEVFADRFRLQLTMIGVLIGLFRIFLAHIVYEIAIAKINAEFCRISHCSAWFDTVGFYRLPCANNNMSDVLLSLIDSVMNWLFEKGLLIGLSRHLHDHIAHDIFM